MFTKLVSIKMWYGGPKAVLYWKNMAEEAAGASVVLSSCGSSFFFFLGAALSSSFNLGSLGLIILFIDANFLVRFARPIANFS